MERIAFSKIDDFREAEINGISGLFTEYRVAPHTLPCGVHRYEIRGDDDGCENFCTVEHHVTVDFTGTMVTCKGIPMMDDKDCSVIREYGSFDEMTCDEWLGQNFAGH